MERGAMAAGSPPCDLVGAAPSQTAGRPCTELPEKRCFFDRTPVCRICLSSDVDPQGAAALRALGICTPEPHPRPPFSDANEAAATFSEGPKSENSAKGGRDLEQGKDLLVSGSENRGSLLELGCACRSEISIAHYACALRWFVVRGEAKCEVCGQVAQNVRPDDVATVLAGLEQRQWEASGLSSRGEEEFGLGLDEEGERGPRGVGDEMHQNIVAGNTLRGRQGGEDPSVTETTEAGLEREQGIVGRLGEMTVVNEDGSRVRWETPENLPSTNRRMALAMAEHKALLDAIAWFDLQRGGDSFEDLGESLFGTSRSSGQDQHCCTPGMRKFLDSCATILSMALITFGFARLIKMLLGDKLSRAGVDFVIGGALAILVVAWFRLVVLPRMLKFCRTI